MTGVQTCALPIFKMKFWKEFQMMTSGNRNDIIKVSINWYDHPVMVFSAIEVLTVKCHEWHDCEKGHRVICKTLKSFSKIFN